MCSSHDIGRRLQGRSAGILILLIILVFNAETLGGAGSQILRLPRALGGCQALSLTVRHAHRTLVDGLEL